MLGASRPVLAFWQGESKRQVALLACPPPGPVLFSGPQDLMKRRATASLRTQALWQLFAGCPWAEALKCRPSSPTRSREALARAESRGPALRMLLFRPEDTARVGKVWEP